MPKKAAPRSVPVPLSTASPELALRTSLSKKIGICFLANRRFEIDDPSVPGDLTFEIPLVGATYRRPLLDTYMLIHTVSIGEHVAGQCHVEGKN